jgi:negative regulator of sigma E activity
MTTCETIQPRLTAYLDGDLAAEQGSVVRGHLRECAACRQVARDEAALRDGLRVLPSVDPPASLWAGVQAKLAAAEVADARRPRWRRSVARWARWAPWPPTMPQVAAGGMLAAAAVVMLYWRTQRIDETASPVAEALALVPTPAIEAQRAAPAAAVAPSPDDVTADLLAEPARITASYAQAIDELMKLAADAGTHWSDELRTAFDAKVAALRDDIARASEGRARQRAQRVLIRYLQGAAVRDTVVLASGGAR